MSYDAEVADESERRKRAVRAMLPSGGDPIGDTTAMTGQDSHALAYSPAHIAGLPDPTPPMPPSEGDVDALSNDRLMNEGSISPSMTVTRPYHADDGAFAGVPLPPISPDWIPKDAKPGEDPLPPPPPPPPPDKDKDAGPSAVLAFGRAAGPRGSAGDDASPVSRYMSTTKKDEPAPAQSEGVDLGSALGGPVERLLQSFRSTATNGRYQPNFTEANRLDAQMNEPMKRAEAARKAREDATKAMAERTAANARAAASLAETNRHNLATEGKTTPEKTPADPAARDKWLLDRTPEERAALGVGPKAAPGAPVISDDRKRLDKARADKAEYEVLHEGDPKAPLAPRPKTEHQQFVEDEAAKRDSLTQDREIRKSVGDNLSDALTAIRDMRKEGTGSTAAIGASDRIAAALPFGIGEQFIETPVRNAMAKEQALRAFQTRMETGLAMTVGERADAKTRFGMNVFSDPKQFAQMLDFYEAIGQQRVRGKQAGMDPEVIARYAKSGGMVAPENLGVVPVAPPPKAPAPVPIGTRKTMNGNLYEKVEGGWKAVQG